MKYIINQTGIVLFMNNKPQKFVSSDPKYAAIIAALRLPSDKQEEAINKALQEADVNLNIEQKGFSVNNATKEVSYYGELLPAPLAQKVFSLIEQNLPVTLLEKFWENLKQNPSYNSVRELYDFLSYKELPITEDGCFLAYRGLLDDFYSVSGNTKTKVLQGVVNSQGQIYNGVGEHIEVQRNCVDDNRENHCRPGLHVGSLDYARDWSRGKLIVVKVNPKDVVSVPSDYQCQKLRCCAYTVVSEINAEILSAATDSQGNPLQDVAFKENVAARNEFASRIQKYLNKKLESGCYTVSFRSIQSSFSPECPSMAEIVDAVNQLGYQWSYIDGSQSKQVIL
jgi:hypothetical protein